MAVGLEQFVKSLEDSGIITPSKLRAVREKLPSEKQHDAQELARELVRLQKLTRFQAQEAYQGKAKSLVLGNYVILDRIGAGGMGQVYKAEHRRMKRIVAIKMLPRSMMKDAAAAARFQREVEAAAKLHHPNIVAAHDADESHGIHFLVMEYVEGSDLSALVKKNGPFAPAKVVDYITQAARGLEAAHAEGIVHRDIKPANLLLDKKGVIKILDMGLARLEAGIGGGDAATQAELTTSGQIMGTVDYMSPEQAFNTKQADARADIYSLGCTLYYLLTGNPLFPGETIMERLLAHREKPIPALAESRDDVPEGVEAVMQKMLAKSPAERYQTMTEVLADLAQCSSESAGSHTRMMVAPESSSGLSFLKGVAPQGAARTSVSAKKSTTKAVSPAPGTTGKSRRHWLVIGGAAVSVCLVAAIALVLFNGRQPAVETPATAIGDSPDASVPTENFALDFNGETSHVNTPLKYDGSHPLTVEAWVKPRSLRSRTVMSNESKGGFTLHATTDWSLKVVHAEGEAVQKSHAAATSDWQHIAGTFDGEGIALYVDGVLQGMQRCPGCKASGYAVLIGGNPAGRVGAVFDGAIDEVRISKSVRYTADFTPKLRFTRDADTLALYHFDENSGTKAVDDSGNGYDATIVDATWTGNDHRSAKLPAGLAGTNFTTDFLLLGDGQSAGWRGLGKHAWNQAFPLHTVQFEGDSGKNSSMLTSQLQSGKFDGLRPRIIVLQIGFNDINGFDLTAGKLPKLVAAYQNLIQLLRTKFPQASIVMAAVPPTKGNLAGSQAFNNAARSIADNKSTFFLDLDPSCLDAEGAIRAELFGVNFTRDGYKSVAVSLKPLVDRLLSNSTSGGVVDLFQYIDPEKGGLDNKNKRRWYWAIDRKVLASDTSNTDTLLPIEYSVPAAYVIEATVVTRKLTTGRPHRLAFGLTSGKNRFSLLFNMPNAKDTVPWTGLTRLDGKPAQNNETGRDIPRMVDAGEHPVRIEVRPESVIAFVDGEKIVDYHGGNGRLSPQFDNRPEAECDLWLLIHDRLQFTKLTLTPLGEQASAPPPADYALYASGVQTSLRVSLEKPFTFEAYVTPSADLNLPQQSLLAFGSIGLAAGKEWTWFVFTKDTPRKTVKAAGGPQPQPGVRTHVAGVYTPTELRLYVNGKKAGVQSLAGIAINPIIRNVEIGYQFTDLIDEVRVSNVARYDGDFDLQPRFENDAETLLLYHCDEGSGSVLNDSSGHKHTGRITNARWVNADGSEIALPAAAGSATISADKDREVAEWALSMGGVVRWVARDSLTMTPRAADKASELPDVPFFLDTFIVNPSLCPDTKRFGNATVNRLNELERLRDAHFYKADLTNAGAKRLAEIRTLQIVTLRDILAIDDDGVRPLAKLPNLTQLNVSATSITDRTLDDLQACKTLTTLNVTLCKQVTREGVARFRQVRPDCTLKSDFDESK